jgi:hypothetical protein
MSSLTNTVLGLAALGIGGYIVVKYVLPKLDLEDMFDMPSSSSSRRDRDRDRDDGPDTIIIEDNDEPEKVPVFVPSPPQTIIEERLVPVSPPPVYVYPNPYPPNCSRGRYWDGDSCRKIECPSGYRWDDGICKPRDCDRDEYFDTRTGRCRDLPRPTTRPRPRPYNPPTPRPDRDWDREGRDWDDDDDNDRNSRNWKLSDIFGRRDRDDDESPLRRSARTTKRPTTNITTLLTPAPKADEDEEEDEIEGRPKTSPVAALAAFTGKRYEYI